MNERPSSLYKYCTARAGLRIVGDSKLRFTPPNQFNDPFDAKPTIRLGGEELDRITGEAISRRHAFAGILNGEQAPVDFPTYRKLNWGREREAVSTNLEKVKDTLQDQAYDSLSSYAGILCLCADPKSLRMWAYYAESHRGCVVEFDVSHQFFATNKGLTPVRYEPNRPIHRYGDSGDWVYQKSEEWRHEAEWRMIGQLSTLEDGGVDDNGCVIHLASIPPETITAIYLGIRMRPEDIRKYEELVQRPARKHINLFRVRPDLEKFALHFDSYLSQPR